MTFNNIVSDLLQAEGLKEQVNRAQMIEIVSKLSMLVFRSENQPDERGRVWLTLYKHGQRQFTRGLVKSTAMKQVKKKLKTRTKKK